MRIGLVIGAGGSRAAPANLPVFDAIREVLFAPLEVPIDGERARLMAPEALLSRLATRGINVDSELRRLLSGGTPNAVHYAAAQVLGRGGAIWTTNFDELIEEAARELRLHVHRVLPGESPDCSCPRGHLLKVHGTLSGQRVVARSEEVLAPLPPAWLARLEQDFADAAVAIVGYAGADIDLRAGLRTALAATHEAGWFARPDDRAPLNARFGDLISDQRLRVFIDERPDLAFLRWAEARGCTEETPAQITQQATQDPEPRSLPAPSYRADALLRALVCDDFGDWRTARSRYRTAVVHGPNRGRATRALLSTGLIHGAVWRPAAVTALKAMCALGSRRAWAHQQLVLYMTWNGHTADAWQAAQRALARVPEDPRLQLQAANVAKECAPADGAALARGAQQWSLDHQHARAAAWATLCLSLSLRWLGQLDEAEAEAARLADGLDALAAPVWRAWGHFETAAVACLRGNAAAGARGMHQAQEVFTAAGADNFVFDAICGELTAERQRDRASAQTLCERARRRLAETRSASRFAREVLRVEEGELARADGRLDEAERHYRALIGSPTVAQALLGLLGLGEVERARGERPTASREALERSRQMGFAFGEVHAAITLGLAGALDAHEAEQVIQHSVFDPPQRSDADGLFRYCLGPEPELHAICFP